MEYTSPERAEIMGDFHNNVIQLVDECKLSPVETLSVLRMIANSIERLFEVSVKGKEK